MGTHSSVAQFISALTKTLDPHAPLANKGIFIHQSPKIAPVLLEMRKSNGEYQVLVGNLTLWRTSATPPDLIGKLKRKGSKKIGQLSFKFSISGDESKTTETFHR